VTLFLLALLAHDPITTKITWTVEISRLVNRRCLSCHGSGSSIDLSSYEQARPWAKAIRNQVLERKMPPWGAVKGFGDFRNDPSLTPLEMEMITQWVEGGAPEGDAAYLARAVSPAADPAVKLRWILAPSVLRKALTILAVRPQGPTEASAMLPDGTVKHLIWVRDSLPKYDRVYIFRDPIVLPVGTRITVVGAGVEISLI
jgi:hypothetical protein